MLLPAVVCLVVGLHFLPLAATFGQPQFWVTGAVLSVFAVVVLVHPGAVVSVGLVGVVSAVVLWVTALVVGTSG